MAGRLPRRREKGSIVMTILVTGGAGYIGSHTCVELLGQGYEVVVLDNLVNSSPAALDRVARITGRRPRFYEGDMLDAALLERIFAENRIDAVIHFAGLKAVGESVAQPLRYFHNNIAGTLTLLDAMSRAGVKRMIFSSSATVYGTPERVPVREDFPRSVNNPYGRTKLMIEDILTDLHTADPEWAVVLLRYFNPIGAHESGLIGENPTGIPNNLMPFITGVAAGRFPELRVFGNDYPTPDGTCVRDYIHVVDLAKGHLCAIRKACQGPGVTVYNLGTGHGVSVLEIVRDFEKATGIRIPCRMAPRRPGDAPAVYADPAKANRELGWKAEKSLEQMCADAWRFQEQNPHGYEN